MYEPKNKLYNNNWGNQYVPLKNMNVVKKFTYKRNRLVGFIKTNNSWHGVEPINQPKGIYRRALAINVGIPESSHLKISNRIIESYYRRKENYLFKKLETTNFSTK